MQLSSKKTGWGYTYPRCRNKKAVIVCESFSLHHCLFLLRAHPPHHTCTLRSPAVPTSPPTNPPTCTYNRIFPYIKCDMCSNIYLSVCSQGWFPGLKDHYHLTRKLQQYLTVPVDFINYLSHRGNTRWRCSLFISFVVFTNFQQRSINSVM